MAPFAVPAFLSIAGHLLAATPAPAVPAASPARPLPAAAAAPLEELSRALEAVAKRVRPSVVQVFATGYAPTPIGDEGDATMVTKQRSTGAGVLLDGEGWLVTNAHVVGTARRVQVVLAPLAAGEEAGSSILPGAGKTFEAKIVGVDIETDLAVLKVEGTGLPSLPLGDSDELAPGQIVLAFGTPLGLENSVTMGVVSAAARQLRPEDPMIYVQTDAPINPGNSGGPLVDARGRVMGINTLIFSQGGGSEGIGFAAPSNIVKNVFEQIRAGGRVRRGTIGIVAQTLSDPLATALGLGRRRGVMIADVAPEGPGAAAGLRVGDIVLGLDGKRMENARQLEVNLYRRPAGTRVRLDVLRGEEPMAATVEVIERTGDPIGLIELVSRETNVVPQLGVLALDLDERVQALLPPLRHDQGVVVAAHSSPTGLVTPGFEVGDVIYAVNRSRVTGLASLRETLTTLAPGQPIAIQVERQGRLFFLVLELE